MEGLAWYNSTALKTLTFNDDEKTDPSLKNAMRNRAAKLKMFLRPAIVVHFFIVNL